MKVQRLGALLKKPWLLVLVGIVYFLASGIQLFWLKGLPYSSSWLEKASVSLTAPVPDFHVGSLYWDVTCYANAPELEPLREYFNKTCKGLKGREAAIALTRDFEKRFPNGSPQVDFFARDYSLLEDFYDHVELGKPGHCVTFSGLLTSVLLSGGCPARVVQVYSQSGIGHNVVEVWDEEKGWLIIDPFLRNLVQTQVNRKTVADDEHLPGSDGHIVSVNGVVSRNSKADNAYYLDAQDGVLKGVRVYPEPWLYLRIGHKSASWPFRGAFAVVGRRPWSFGPLQRLLGFGILITLVLGSGCLACAVYQWYRPLNCTQANTLPFGTEPEVAAVEVDCP